MPVKCNIVGYQVNYECSCERKLQTSILYDFFGSHYSINSIRLYLRNPFSELSLNCIIKGLIMSLLIL